MICGLTMWLRFMILPMHIRRTILAVGDPSKQKGENRRHLSIFLYEYLSNLVMKILEIVNTYLVNIHNCSKFDL